MGDRTASDSCRAERLARFEEVTRWPLLGVAAASIPIAIGRGLADDAPEWVSASLGLAGVLVRLIMAADIGARTWLAPRPGRYLARHKLDVLAIVIPPARIVRELRLVQGVFIRPGLQRFAVFTTASIVVGAALVYSAERGRDGATINSFGESLWWAAVTSTTVGYGDQVPITPQGRIVATCLMVLGISLFAVLTAHIAAHFVESDPIETAWHGEITDRLARIESMLVGFSDATQEEGARSQSPLPEREDGEPR